MIQRLQIRGFKCFDDEDFSIAPLTLLSGLNSSGKSSFLQAIKLIYGHTKTLPGYGPLRELVSALHSEFEIIMTSNGTDYVFRYPDTASSEYSHVEPALMSFISAARLGPELHLPVAEDPHVGHGVGERGEYVLDFLERHSELAGLPEILRHPGANSSAVKNNVSAWLDIISPGITFEWESISKADLIRAEYSHRRPTNVGFGVSYTLPIIANVLGYAALVAKGEQRGAVIMVENPEAHLHPAGQTKIGDFLARAVACGVQVIVETHSEHILYGIRLAVKNGLLKPDRAIFYYFTYNFDEVRADVRQPMIDEGGFIDEWPSGFFDETENSLQKLL